MTIPPRRGSNKIVAIGLLTEQELRNVGTGLNRVYHVPHDNSFDDLLKAIAEKTRCGRSRG